MPNYPNGGAKASMYFPAEMLERIHAEARRLDRSFSWVVQRAWVLAEDEIAAMPTINPGNPQ